MAKLPLRDRLKQAEPLLADGAMGTLLHQRGAAINACFDALNLTAPELVKQIHHDYIMAGSRLIETNTFGANRYKLDEYGLGGNVVEINQAAVKIVQEAIAKSGCDEDIYVAGSVGPIRVGMRPYGRLNKSDVRTAYVEQIRALAHAGVDCILLETFTDHQEIFIALDVI